MVTTIASKARSRWVGEFCVSSSEIVYLRLALVRGRCGARTISLLTSDEVSPLISRADQRHLWQLRALVRVCTSEVMLISMTEDTLQHLLLNPLGVGI